MTKQTMHSNNNRLINKITTTRRRIKSKILRQHKKCFYSHFTTLSLLLFSNINMQKSILAASVLALASGTVVIPKSHTKSSMSKAQAKVRHAEFHARDKNTAKNVAAVLEQDGVSLKNHNEKYKYFEMSMGEADCQQTVATVEGNTMFRCIDMLWDYSEENGYPTPPVTESEGMYYPSNGGFPINVWFHGHGCNEDNMGGTWRMNKQDMGFPATYKPGKRKRTGWSLNN
jgi:hypothetical protein